MDRKGFARLTVSALLLAAPALRAQDAPPAPDAWTARVRQSLAAREYEATVSALGLQAPNRRQNFRAYFDARGLRLVDRTADGSPELARIELAWYGRPGRRVRVTAGELSTSGTRVEIVRSGGPREAFRNAPEGLEQSFTLRAPPDGEGSLILRLRVQSAAVEPADDGVLLRSPSGRMLALRRLPVSDARGRLLPSRLVAAGATGIRLTVEDRDAVYPLTVGLLFTGPAATLLQSDQAHAQFGISVASAGDVNGDGFADAIVGAFQYDAGETDEGAAFVFLGGPTGLLGGVPSGAATTLQGNQAGAKFGISVAGAGDVNGDGYADVVVGAFLYSAGETNEGAAFVFLGSATGIASGGPGTAATFLESNQATARFGVSVAGAGDVNGDGYADVLVGAYQYDAGEADEGAAFVFLGSASGVASAVATSAASKLQGNQAFAKFGWSVASAGDVNGDGKSDVLVGAYTYDAPEADEGAAFLFLADSGGTGIASGGPSSASATLQGNQTGANFGFSVAAAGDVNGDGFGDVVVGAILYDAGQTDEGAAFVFLGAATGIASGGPGTASATLQGDQAAASFGYSLAGAGDTNGDGYADIVVGAFQYDAGQTDEGAAFVFLGGSTGIANSGAAGAAATLQADQAAAEFGVSAALADFNGDGYADALVGSYLFDSGQVDEGAVFSYHGGASGLTSGGPAGAATSLLGNEVFSGFGGSVAGAGDINGDGYADVLVGAPSESDGVSADAGAAYAFLGGPAGIATGGPATAGTTWVNSQNQGGFGFSVAGAGDVNGDGYADVLIGANSYDLGETDEGAVFLYLGSPAGIANGGPSSAAATLQGNQVQAFFGTSLASAGDVNGDGYADILVGANKYDAGQTDEGAVFLFLGSATGIASAGAANASAVLQSDQAGAELGASVAGGGDVNGDGYADVVVGAPRYDNFGTQDAGAAYVFLGGVSGIASGNTAGAARAWVGSQSHGDFGNSVAGAGDVNGDGLGDVVIGEGFSESVPAELDEGAAYVFLGSAGSLPMSPATTLQGNQAGAWFGTSVAGVGDVNGDGYADVLVGAIGFDDGQNNEGAAFLFLGGPAGIGNGGPATAAAILESDQVDTGQAAQFGASVAGAGDVNGDGFADVLVGATRFGIGNLGGAFVFLGNGRAGRPVLARQFRAASSVPVAPWGSSQSPNRFDTRMLTYHPEGGGRVKLEVEACASGVDFGAVSCTRAVSPSWTAATASAGISLTLPIPGLASTRPYHWRARTLYAPASVTQAGIVAPPKPAHGPWRRLSGQAVEADIQTTAGGGFFTVAPCRIVDTRPGSGTPIGGPILSSGFVRVLALGGQCGVPGSAFAVSANITAVSATGPGSMVFYAAAGAPPNTSNISFNGGQTRANNTILALNNVGQVQVLATVANPAGADEVHLIVDVNGYFE